MNSYNEAYVFKKPKTLLTIEREIRLLRTKWLEACNNKEKKMDKETKLLFKKDLGKSSSVIYKELVKEFNFGKKFDFVIEISDIINAWSSHFRYEQIDMSNYQNIIEVSSDKRMRFTNRDICNAKITFTTGILFEKEMNPEYLVAIMLHEIGHIFSFIFFKLSAELDALQNILSKKLNDKELVEKYNNYNKKEKRSADDAAIDGALITFSNPYSQEGEKFADHFAAYYGYGYELAQGLAVFFKIGGFKEPKDGVLNKLSFDLNCILTDLLVGNYPNTFNRINFILNAMKRELEYNDSLTDKQKRELREKIKNINKLNAELYSTKYAKTPYGYLRNTIYSNKVNQTKDLDNRHNQLMDDYIDKKLF